MNTLLQKRILKWVVGIHIGLISAAIVIPAVQKLFKPKPPIIIPVAFFEEEKAPIEDIQIEEVESLPDPEPEPVEIPLQTNKPPKKVEEPKPEKPKWKPKEVVRQNKRVTRTSDQPKPVTPQRKRITAADIQKALGPVGGTTDPHGAYYNTLMQRMYAVWQVPVGAPIGLSALGSINVSANGTVSNRQLIRSSGDAAFDQSVQKALNTVNRLPAPPAELANRPITITFEPQ